MEQVHFKLANRVNPRLLRLLSVADNHGWNETNYDTKTGYFPLPVGNICHLSCWKKMDHPYESRIRHQDHFDGEPRYG